MRHELWDYLGSPYAIPGEDRCHEPPTPRRPDPMRSSTSAVRPSSSTTRASGSCPTPPSIRRAETYRIGKFPLKKLTNPAVSVAKVGKVDAVLLTHDTHADNFDDAGRKLAGRAGTVISTPTAAKRLPGAIGLRPWHTTTLQGRDGITVTITATPARHAMFGVHLFAGPVTGFLVTAPGRSIVYITGDNVSRKAIRRVARNAVVDVAILHAGAPKFRSSGPIRFCMTAKQAARAARTLRARRLIVVHSEGWAHFSETMADVDTAFSTPELQAARIVAPMGKRVEIAEGFDCRLPTRPGDRKRIHRQGSRLHPELIRSALARPTFQPVRSEDGSREYRRGPQPQRRSSDERRSGHLHPEPRRRGHQLVQHRRRPAYAASAAAAPGHA